VLQQVCPGVQVPDTTHDAAALAKGAITIRITGPAIPTLPSMRRRERLTLGSSEPFSSNPASANCLSVAKTASEPTSVSTAIALAARCPSQSAQMRDADEFKEDALWFSST